jgi:ATP-dependent exoDNAse (exonuclease V) alpha subunit
MPTVIIVVHHASKRMLCRENLYTAITRASQRVVILSTDFGMRIALTTQKIYGKNLSEKIKQYQRYMGEGDVSMALMHVRLTTEDA